MQSEGVGPPQVAHDESQFSQEMPSSSYVPALHDATQAALCLSGLLLEHETQSGEPPPVHVPQSAWHAAQLPPDSYRPSPQAERHSRS